MISIEKTLLLNLTSGRRLGATWNNLATEPLTDAEIPETFLLNGRHVAELRQLNKNGMKPVAEHLQALSARADEISKEGPWSVVDKEDIPEGFDPHDYRSLAKYWWPNPDSSNGLPFIKRDGEVNPACYSANNDLSRFIRFTESHFLLSLSASLNRNEAHWNKAYELLKVWFINPATRQTPHFNHAQEIHGQHSIRHPAVIESRRLIYVLEAIALLRLDNSFPDDVNQGLRQWFTSYLKWLRESEIGVRAAGATNNIALWYDLQCAACAWHTGDPEMAEQILTNDTFKRLDSMLAADGELTEETSRARPYEYIAFSLTALAGLAAAGDRLGIPIWSSESSEGKSFAAAWEWLQSLPQSRSIDLGIMQVANPNENLEAGEIDSKLYSLLLNRVNDAQRKRIYGLLQKQEGARQAHADQVAAMNKSVRKLNTQIATLKLVESEREEAFQKLKSKQAQTEELQEQLEAANDKAARVLRTDGEKSDRIDCLEESLRETRKNLAKAKKRAEYLETEMRKVKTSFAWRLTYPGRFVWRCFHGGLGGGKPGISSAERQKKPSQEKKMGREGARMRNQRNQVPPKPINLPMEVAERVRPPLDSTTLKQRRGSLPALFYLLPKHPDVAPQSAGPRKGVIDAIRTDADAALGRGPFSVIHKTTLPPSGDLHDYWHPAPYWWPNPDTRNQLPFVRRDGERVPGTEIYDPESDKYDRTRLQRMFDDTTSLVLAWWFYGEESYLEHGALLVRTWFLADETRMTPHLGYSQVRMGHAGNKGTATGIIEMKDLYYFLDAVRLLIHQAKLSPNEISRLKEWFSEYLQWLLDSKQGRAECSARNNHGLAFDLQIASITEFLGEHDEFIRCVTRAHDRLADHFAASGEQLHEMARTLTAHYCTFNLQQWINLAHIAGRCGENLWEAAPQRTGRPAIRRGMEWLLRFIEGTQWPYRQIKPFDTTRWVPISHAYVEKYQRPVASPLMRPITTCMLHFNPHDGIPLYWQLTLESWWRGGSEPGEPNLATTSDGTPIAANRESSPTLFPSDQ